MSARDDYPWVNVDHTGEFKPTAMANEILRLRIGVCQLINEYPDFGTRAKWAAQIFGKRWAEFVTGAAMA